MVGSGADRAADRRSGAAGTGAEKEAAVKTVGAMRDSHRPRHRGAEPRAAAVGRRSPRSGRCRGRSRLLQGAAQAWNWIFSG